MKCLASHRKLFFVLFILFASVSTVLLVSGCAAGAFLTDLESVIPVAGTGIAAILSILASIDPAVAPAVAIVTPLVTKVQADLAQIETLQAQYKANANEGTLADIESLLTSTTADLATLTEANGLPAAEAAQVQAIAVVVNTQLQALISTLPVLAANTAGQTLTVTKPSSTEVFKAKIAAATAGSPATT